MKNNFPHVFSPLTVRGMTLKNRVVMMPMGSDFAGHDGELSDEHIKYYELRARGGTGLIMVENVCVKYPEGSNGTTQLRLDKDCYIPRLFTLTEACHRQGALMGIQINHAGASAMSSRIGMRPVSASRFPSKAGGEIPRGLSKEEIESIFVKSDYKLVQIELKKILYVEGLKDYVKIYTEDSARAILSLMSMKSMEELLPASRFMRVHRSYIVQKEKIRVIDRGRIVFDKTYIPVSDSYKQVFQAFLDKRS